MIQVSYQLEFQLVILLIFIDEIPQSYYDEEIETEKEFLDIASATILNNGLENITTTKVILMTYLTLNFCNMAYL